MLKVQKGNVIWHETLRMLKFHPITAFMKTYTNFKQLFLVGVFWFKYMDPIKFKIPILDLMLLPKSVPFEGLYYSSGTVPSSNSTWAKKRLYPRSPVLY